MIHGDVIIAILLLWLISYSLPIIFLFSFWRRKWWLPLPFLFVSTVSFLYLVEFNLSKAVEFSLGDGLLYIVDSGAPPAIMFFLYGITYCLLLLLEKSVLLSKLLKWLLVLEGVLYSALIGLRIITMAVT